MSPTVFREKGYRFFFFSKEETRMHVHVISGDGEAKYWLEPEIELSKQSKYSNKQLSEIKSRSTKMKSSQLGRSTSEVEFTNISIHGIWLFANGTEHFLPYDQYPWFKDKTVSQIGNVEESSPGHYYWPDLDVDLSESILQNPGAYPLQANPLNNPV